MAMISARSSGRRQIARGVVVGLACLAIAATKGPDGGGYTATDSVVYSLVNLAGGGGAGVLAGTDDGAVALTLPFPFRFYGKPYTVICASANGAIYFVAAAGECSGIADFGNVDLTTAATPNDLPAALPLWTDLTFEVPGAGSVLYQTVGALGSRSFIVQWHNAYPQGSPNPVTFQAVLAEKTHTLLFQYQTVGLGDGNPATNGKTASVGIRNAQGLSDNKHLSWSYNAAVIADQSALFFSAPIVQAVGDVDSDGLVDCTDVQIVKASVGKRTGQAGFDPRADLVRDGVISVQDLATVTRALPAGLKCP